MHTQAKTLYYVSDGTFSVEVCRPALERNGELLVLATGEAKFVPDDPTFPTTVFRRDGVIELHVEDPKDTRLGEYIKSLSGWLKVGLQEKEE